MILTAAVTESSSPTQVSQSREVATSLPGDFRDYVSSDMIQPVERLSTRISDSEHQGPGLKRQVTVWESLARFGERPSTEQANACVRRWAAWQVPEISALPADTK